MAQQTAVDWLEKELKNRYPLINSEPLFQQAKQMEGEQHKKTWMDSTNQFAMMQEWILQ